MHDRVCVSMSAHHTSIYIFPPGTYACFHICIYIYVHVNVCAESWLPNTGSHPFNLSGLISLNHPGFMHLACLLQWTLIRDQPDTVLTKSGGMNYMLMLRKCNEHVVQEASVRKTYLAAIFDLDFKISEQMKKTTRGKKGKSASRQLDTLCIILWFLYWKRAGWNKIS